MKYNLKLITALMLCSFLLLPFDSKAEKNLSSASKEKIISEWNLPPKPNAIINAATIEGIDSDNDMVRDDIQREMAFASYPNKKEYNMYTKAAKLIRQANQAYADGDFKKVAEAYKKASLILECSSEFFDFTLDNQGKLIDLFYDTTARNSISLKIERYSPIRYYTKEDLNNLCPALAE